MMAKTHHYIGYKYGWVVKIYCDWLPSWQPLSGRLYCYKDDADWEIARCQAANPRHRDRGWIFRSLWVHYRCYSVMDKLGIGEYVWA
jgi:hypothetical protein